jgi:hypothetical protein
MLFNRKSTDDWPCFVSVLLLVRSSHVHQYSRLSKLCQYFLQKLFFESAVAGLLVRWSEAKLLHCKGLT